MSKILGYIIFVFLGLLIPCECYALSKYQSVNNIDITKLGSLTLNYNYDNFNFDNANVKIYYIASMTSNFGYQMSSDFLGCSIKIDEFKTVEEWEYLKQVLDNYIITNNIRETNLEIIKNNEISLINLDPGLYLVKTDSISYYNSNIVFDTILVSIPNLIEEKIWDYDIDVYVKAEERFIDNEEYSPDTGDDIGFYFCLLIISFIVIIILIVKFIFKIGRNRISS